MPQEFKDRNGKAWTLALTGASVRRLAARFGDMNAVMQTGEKPIFLGQIVGSDAVLAETLYVICKGQADAAKLTEDDFCDLLTPDVLTAAEKAFFEEWSFFCRSRGNPEMVQAIEAARNVYRMSYAEFSNKTAEALAKLRSQQKTDSPPSGGDAAKLPESQE